MEEIKYWIYCNGEKFGLGLVAMPWIRDLVLNGAREWNLVSTGIWGTLVQIVGVTLIILSKNLKGEGWG